MQFANRIMLPDSYKINNRRDQERRSDKEYNLFFNAHLRKESSKRKAEIISKELRWEYLVYLNIDGVI